MESLSRSSMAAAEAAAPQETHAQAQRKQEQMSKISAAFGLHNTVEGQAFDQELQAKRKEERMHAKEEALKAKLQKEEELEERRRKCVAVPFSRRTNVVLIG